MNPKLKLAATAFLAAGLFTTGYSSALVAQHATSSNAHGTHSQANTSGTPSETGQSAFAALAEVVAILEADPDTDWSKVNMAGLRDHLVDMNALTLNATVAVDQRPDGAEFIVTGEDVTLRAIQSMVPAHANELNKMSDWQAKTQLLANGARLTITSSHQSVVAKINALGFFGLMATGAHHQPHHLGMAKGTMVH